MIEHLADSVDQSTDPFGWDFVIGCALIGLAIAVWAIGRSPQARRSVGRATGRAAIGTMRATGRPIRALGRRSRSGLIGHWGRSVVGCENRAMAAAEAGKHDRAKFWRGLGDAMIGSSRITCHVPGCDWEHPEPNVPDVVAHLRSHRDDNKTEDEPDTESKPNTNTTNSGDQPATATTTEGDTTMETIVIPETITEFAALLEQKLIPAIQREADAAVSSANRVNNIDASMQGGTDNMAGMSMPSGTLAKLMEVVGQINRAAQAVSAAQRLLADAAEGIASARGDLRGQEAVAETAQAAGGAMDKAAYAG